MLLYIFLEITFGILNGICLSQYGQNDNPICTLHSWPSEDGLSVIVMVEAFSSSKSLSV